MPGVTQTERSVLSTVNSTTLISGTNNAEYNLASGTIAASTTNTATLESGADGQFVGSVIEIVSSGSRCPRLITAFTSLVATVSSNWDILPDSDAKYVIHVNSGKLPLQVVEQPNFCILLPSTASSIDNFYTGSCIKILGGQGKGQAAIIRSYNGTTKIAQVEPEFTTTVRSDSLYAIYGEGGISPGGNSASTLIFDGNQSSAVVPFMYVEIMSGTGSGQIRMISALVDDSATITPNWDIVPDSTSRYAIFSGWGADQYETVLKHAIVTITLDADIYDGQKAIFEMQSSMGTDGSARLTTLLEFSLDQPRRNHAITVTTSHFRLKAISMGIGLDGQIQTIYNSYKSGKVTAQLEEVMQENNDCDVTRSVIVGKSIGSKYRNISTDIDGNLSVSIKNPVDGFGSLTVTQPKQFTELLFNNNYVNPAMAKSEVANGGTVTSVANMLNVATGTNVAGKAVMYSLRRARYTPGLALNIRFTALFTAPVADSVQLAGFGDSCNAFCVGYNGLDFGILHRANGINEIRRLSVTSVSSADDTITVTLNGVTSAGIAILSTDNTQKIARKIAGATSSGVSIFAALGSGWDVYEEKNSSVVFVARTAGPQSGTYTYNVGTSNSVGSFATEVTGVTPTETWTNRYDWNCDRGLGVSDLPVLNFQYGNVFEISMQWLGFGGVAFRIENPRNGTFTNIHQIKYANANTSTSLQNPNLPLYVHAEKLAGSNADNLVVKSGSMSIFIMGENDKFLGTRLGQTTSYSTTSGALSAGQYYNVISIRNKMVFKSARNFSEIYAVAVSASFSCGSDITRGGVFTFFSSAVLDNASTLTWTDRNAALSVVEYCTNAAAILGGNELWSIPCGPNFSTAMPVTDLEMMIPPGLVVTIGFKPFQALATTPSTSTADISFSALWIQR
jgi:hypothetical protein